MVLGLDTSVAGFATQGDIQVGSNTMILLDANHALLGQLNPGTKRLAPATCFPPMA